MLPLVEFFYFCIFNSLKGIELLLDHGLVLLLEMDEREKLFFGVRRGQVAVGLREIIFL
jgi:hypothetical protein